MARPGCTLLFAFLLTGCAPSAAEPPDPDVSAQPASQVFDPAACGQITGRVLWTGPPPVVEPLTIIPNIGGLEALRERKQVPNPNAPRIASEGGVAGAVILLRGVDASRARPWNLPPVMVEMSDYRFVFRQGETTGPYGFVRRGAAIEMVSRQPVAHGLHADGAAFFTLAFLDPDQPLSRRLERPGVVELSSSIGYFWMRAYLFVAEHPYYTASAAEGTFTLADVPEGTYEVVCWMPNWHLAGRDLDPEAGTISRQRFRQPVEVKRSIRVEKGKNTRVDFSLDVGLFAD